MSDGGNRIYRYSIIFASANTRKHKKWEGDGFLTIRPTGEAQLTEECGREIARSTITTKKREELSDGYILMVGGYEVEMQEELETLLVAVPPPPKPKLPSPKVVQPTVSAGFRLKSTPSLLLKRPPGSPAASPEPKRRLEEFPTATAAAAPEVCSPKPAKPRPFSASCLIKSASS
ncbi:hypothetical protein PENTCL1PPCAC_19494, partial [Pristionchus entomophagus]